MKNTLLDDLVKVYYTIECKPVINSWCKSCSCCSNKLFCDMIEKLINSIKKYY